MDWEEIDNRAKRTVVQVVRRLAEEEVERQEESDEIVRELMETRFFDEEMQRRGKYNGNKAFRRVQLKKRRRLIRWVGVVACCLSILLGSIWFFSMERLPETVGISPVYGIHDGQQVFLQLSDGKRVALGGKDTLHLWEENKSIEVRGGKITYSGDTHTDKCEDRQNTLSVPRGGEFLVKLSDGTVVYLNADSELTYPLTFSGKERRIYLKGEAWFEVAKNPDVPFYVVAEDVEIRVYGTSFNVNTHGTKTIQTVLVEGNIGVRSLRVTGEVRVQPGQLAEYGRTDHTIRLREVNVRQYTAWKNGYFYFDDKMLEEIMEELARWYNMEIVYRSERGRTLHFSGYLQRYKDVRKVLATMTEAVGIRFDVVEKQIVVD